jgi:hypothetical protein
VLVYWSSSRSRLIRGLLLGVEARLGGGDGMGAVGKELGSGEWSSLELTGSCRVRQVPGGSWELQGSVMGSPSKFSRCRSSLSSCTRELLIGRPRTELFHQNGNGGPTFRGDPHDLVPKLEDHACRPAGACYFTEVETWIGAGGTAGHADSIAGSCRRRDSCSC